MSMTSGRSAFPLWNNGDAIALNTSERPYTDIVASIKRDTATLPSLPDIASRVSRAIQDPKHRVADIAKIVQADLTIATRLIQIANSPIYRGVVPVTDCGGAITRLGGTVTRNLVTSIAMRRLFEARLPVIKAQLDELWSHSTRVAAISAILARITLGLQADRALLAGLIHDIGVLPILRHAHDRPEFADAAILADLIHGHKAEIGAWLLQEWHFDPDLVDVALSAEAWQRDSAHADYCDIVIVANIHSYFGRRAPLPFPPLENVPAFKKFSVFHLGPAASIELLHEAEQDIAELQALLRN